MDTVVAALDVTGCADEVTVVAERLATALGAHLEVLATGARAQIAVAAEGDG